MLKEFLQLLQSLHIKKDHAKMIYTIKDSISISLTSLTKVTSLT